MSWESGKVFPFEVDNLPLPYLFSKHILIRIPGCMSSIFLWESNGFPLPPAHEPLLLVVFKWRTWRSVDEDENNADNIFLFFFFFSLAKIRVLSDQPVVSCLHRLLLKLNQACLHMT